jgi:hypothetical protein
MTVSECAKHSCPQLQYRDAVFHHVKQASQKRKKMYQTFLAVALNVSRCVSA